VGPGSSQITTVPLEVMGVHGETGRPLAEK
jgi:hypothetical protein